jgi:formate dehydrogenase subunit gamma
MIKRIFAISCGLCLVFALGLGFAAHGAQPADGAREQAQRQLDQPGNNAPFWREVRKGENAYQVTQARGIEANILVQSQGETWRQLRPPIAFAGGLIICIALLGLAGYYNWRGKIGVHDQPTGRYIRRFSDVERLTHWTVGISFVTLGITGAIITFGKYVLIPIVGHTLFSWLAIVFKNLHNFIAPVFVLALPVLIVLFVRDNLLKAYDIQWLVKFGGMLSKSGEHVPSGRFNAGEKALFWGLVCALSTVLCISGAVLLFPNFGQGRSIMQISNVMHGVCALLAIAMACFHVYLGTVGMKGAYQAMRTGYVDETWAKEHHSIWYDQVKAGKAAEHFSEEVPPAIGAQVAQALKS